MDNLTLAYVLILIGLTLLLAEVFVISGGLLSVLSLTCLIVGVALSFNVSPSMGFGTLVFLFLAIPVLIGLALYIAPRTPIGRRIFLPAPPEDETLAHSPVNLELEQLRGRYGRTVSALRPAGVTDFDGRRVDTISEGAMIGPGQWVQCVDVHAGRVIVRPVGGPPDLENMDTSALG